MAEGAGGRRAARWGAASVRRPGPAPGLGFAALDLLREAVSVPDGERFTLTYERWAHAVDDRMRVVPGWRPLKQPTAADPPGDPESAPLTAWLTRRAAAHLDWAGAYAPERSWAFTPYSLSALEALVRRITPTAEELNDPANREFREGAAWYLGETARRAFAGQWNLNLRRSGERNFPYVEKLGSRGARLTPVIVLEGRVEGAGSPSAPLAADLRAAVGRLNQPRSHDEP